jgi:hypothetical protein
VNTDSSRHRHNTGRRAALGEDVRLTDMIGTEMKECNMIEPPAPRGRHGTASPGSEI